MKEITNHDYKFWADAANNLIKGLPKLLSAIKTLEQKGYSYNGGELWKPPIGKAPNFNLIDSLNEKIEELESDKHINEIKAQGVEEAIKGISKEMDKKPFLENWQYNAYYEAVKYLNLIRKQLRANHE